MQEPPLDPTQKKDDEVDNSATNVNDNTNKSVRSSKSKKSNDGGGLGGAKVKMPSAQLTAATIAEKQVIELQEAGDVPTVVLNAVNKLAATVNKLRQACDAVQTTNEAQNAAKVQWIEKNVVPKESYLHEVRSALELSKNKPRILVNDDLVSSAASSRRSKASEAVRQAAAEEVMLETERRRMLRRREQQEEERKLRLKRIQMQDEERRLQEQREQEDLEARLEQARLKREMLENDGSEDGRSRRSHISRASGAHRSLRSLPVRPQPVPEWIEASSQHRAGPTAQRQNSQNHQVNLASDSFEDLGPLENSPMHLGAVNAGLLQQALLPTVKLPTFKGESINFMWFIRAFELQVEAITTDPARRLHLLLQHLQGEAHDLVRGCQLAGDPRIGFQRAKARLMEEYGNPVKQTLAFKQKLLSWPLVRKDPKEMRAFYTQLQLCAEVKSNGRMAELDSSSTLLQLMHKLPSKLQESWQRKACRIESSQMRETTFDDFVRFIKEQSEAANHPVFGKISVNDESQRQKARALATKVEEEGEEETIGNGICTATVGTSSTSKSAESGAKNAFSPPCLLCGGKHAAENCLDASNLPIDQKKEALRGLCFGCLQPGHLAKYCRTRATCRTCSKLHPTILHDKTRESNVATPKTSHTASKAIEETAKKEIVTTSTGAAPKEKSCLAKGSVKVALSVVPIKVWLKQQRQSVTVKAVLDNGSTATFVSQQLVDRLGLPKNQNTKLQLATMTDKAVLSTQVVHGLRVCDIDSNNVITLSSAYVVPTMPITQKDLPTRAEVEQWPHLAEVPFDWEHEDAPVEMLIGMDVSPAQEPLKIVSGRAEHNEPYAKKTRLGWVLNGPLQREQSSTLALSTIVPFRAETSAHSTIIRQLHQLYYKDFEDAFDFSNKGPSQEDIKWLQMVRASVSRTTSNKYEIALPFRQEKPPLQNNFTQALARLRSLEHKFRSNEKFKSDYIAFVKKMEEGGYVEELDLTLNELAEEASKSTELISYVPHHGVYHPRKPGKIRVVFNCSSKYHGTSLNDCLLQGPDLTSSLVGVLTRFRQERVAFMADIEAMFYQVQVPEGQRNALRYLWWPGGEVGKTKAYRLKVHLFGAASSPSCSNFALRHAAEEAYEAQIIDQEVKQTVENNFYVDDCLKSMPDENSAIGMAQGLIKACNHGGFKLAKFISTSKRLLKTLNKTDLIPELQTIDLQDDKGDPLGAMAERALGVAWKLKEDAFCFKITQNKDNNLNLNKRHILSKLSSLYDPLGFAAPVVIVARILFRDLVHVDWDEDIQTTRKETTDKWSNWITELETLQGVTIPRCFRPKETQTKWELHLFSDASLNAYAAVAYLRQPSNERGKSQKAHIAFLFGKARVSPPKVVTIPRLELAAAKLAVDIATMMQNELSSTYVITQRYFWSDSQTVLKYLNNSSKRFHTYVANRIQSILSATCTHEWHYVPSAHNPADEGTRGLQSSDLPNSQWINGPRFLKLAEEHWPRLPSEQSLQVDEGDPEIKALITSTRTEMQEAFVNQWAKRYSSMNRFRRAAWVLLCFKKFLKSRNNVSPHRPSLIELRQAERALLMWLQSECLTEEWKCLEDKKSVPKASPLSKLSPQLHSNLIVMNSRTRVLLPIVPKGEMSMLLIKEAHQTQLHFGRQATAAAILNKYWIIGLNKSVRTVVKQCPACQKRKATPQNPIMAPLPHFRCETPSTGAAFETAGIDYFGPITIRSDQGEQTKIYGVIFTCAASRAVHLEAATNLSSGGFLNALRRFIA